MVYWISGFYFTQSFITGVLQNYSRKNRFQIDMILIEFAVTKFEAQVPGTPEVGAYIRVSLLANLLCNPKHTNITLPKRVYNLKHSHTRNRNKKRSTMRPSLSK